MIKPIDPDTTVTLVSPFDPAIDEDASNIENYKQDFLKDPEAWRKHLVMKEGAQPTEFIFGVIPTSILNRIEGESGYGQPLANMSMLSWGAFLHGLRDIKNGPTVETTDRAGKPTYVVPKVRVNDVEYVDPTWLSRTFVKHLREGAIHIGYLGWKWQQLDPGDVKK